MSRSFLGGFLIAVAGIAASAPAHAQFFENLFGPRIFAAPAPAPQAIAQRLRQQGYRPSGPMRLNGNVVLTDAVTPDGRHARLVIDSATGSIIQRFARTEPRPLANVRRSDSSAAFDDGGDSHLLPRPDATFLNDGSPATRPPKGRTKPRATVATIPAPQSAPLEPAADVHSAAMPQTGKTLPVATQPEVSASASASGNIVSPAPKADTATLKPGSGGAAFANGVPLNPLD